MTPERFLLHRLALALGRTVGELESTLTVREFADWVTFTSEHPLPIDVVDMHAAIHTSTLINVNRSNKTPAVEWQRFLLLRARPALDVKPVLTIAQRMKRAAGQ